MLSGSTVTLVERGVGFTTGDVSGHAAVALAVYGTSLVLAVLLVRVGTPTFVAMSVFVLLVLTGTVAVARLAAVRLVGRDDPIR